VRACLDLDVPFGQRHDYMGTHNHLLQLGGADYLEIVAVDPKGNPPPCARWFGLDDRKAVVADWDAGRRLRGWVARTDAIDQVLVGREAIFGRKISLPWQAPTFEFALTGDGALPRGGAAPALIDRRGRPRAMTAIADLGARLRDFTLAHPDPAAVAALYRELAVDRPPDIVQGETLRWRARIDTPSGERALS
jgi:hypothetical protein